MNKDLETKIYLQSKGFDDYEIEELIEDYIPEVEKCIGFEDNRSDKRFVVKFHDICFFTNTPEDMDEETFDYLFDIFCSQEYEATKDFMDEECVLSEQKLFKTYEVGHYQMFEYIVEDKITEENVIDIAIDIYNEGLSPYYIHDYTKLSNYLYEMEKHYMEWWLDFLREEEEVNDGLTKASIKNIERRMKDWEEKRKQIKK